MSDKKPEPVAWWNGNATVWFDYELMGMPAPDGCTIPLYEEPPRREWVGLTDEDTEAIYELARESYRRHRCGTRGQQVVPQDSQDWHLIHAVAKLLKAKNT